MLWFRFSFILWLPIHFFPWLGSIFSFFISFFLCSARFVFPLSRFPLFSVLFFLSFCRMPIGNGILSVSMQQKLLNRLKADKNSILLLFCRHNNLLLNEAHLYFFYDLPYFFRSIRVKVTVAIAIAMSISRVFIAQTTKATLLCVFFTSRLL